MQPGSETELCQFLVIIPTAAARLRIESLDKTLAVRHQDRPGVSYGHQWAVIFEPTGAAGAKAV